jgi:adenine C2-methylase RlmN of 23S rRNA A2503 and tRNA A37
MGEPLKNYDAVLNAIRGMTDANRFGLAPSRITLSTVGVVPAMLQLTRDIPQIQLALSLHAPTQELRQKIVPTAKSWPLDKLIEACDYFILRSKKKILIEYVLLDGVNSSEKEANELGQLLQGKEVMINLIPYNSTSVATEFKTPSKENSIKFQEILIKKYKLFTTIRVEMGGKRKIIEF